MNASAGRTPIDIPAPATEPTVWGFGLGVTTKDRDGYELELVQ